MAAFMNAATCYGDAAEVRRLLEQGAEPDALLAHGTNALMKAAYRGYLEVCRVLVDAGASVNAQVLGYAKGETKSSRICSRRSICADANDSSKHTSAPAAGAAARRAPGATSRCRRAARRDARRCATLHLAPPTRAALRHALAPQPPVPVAAQKRAPPRRLLWLADCLTPRNVPPAWCPYTLAGVRRPLSHTLLIL